MTDDEALSRCERLGHDGAEYIAFEDNTHILWRCYRCGAEWEEDKPK